MRRGRGSPWATSSPSSTYYSVVTVTSQSAVKVMPLYVVDAVIVHLPGSTAVTVPLATVATEPFELFHVTVPPEGHVVAVSDPV